VGVKELPRLAANHDTFAACFILNTAHHRKRNGGVDVQITVCTNAFAGIAVLGPAVNGHLYCGRVASVLRIPNHGRGPIKNLARSSVEVVVSIHPASQGQRRIGHRAGDIVAKTAALPRSVKGFNHVLALLDLRLKLGPCLWRQSQDEVILVGLYHRVPLRNEVVQSSDLLGFYFVLLRRVEVVDGLLEFSAKLPSSNGDRSEISVQLAGVWGRTDRGRGDM